MKHRSFALKLRLLLYTAVLLLFLLIPSAAVETSPISLCLIRNLFGVECLTCGITRGVSHFFHGNFLRAWELNPLTYAVIALYVLFFLSDLRLLLRMRRDAETDNTSIFEKLWRWVFPTSKK